MVTVVDVAVHERSQFAQLGDAEPGVARRAEDRVHGGGQRGGGVRLSGARMRSGWPEQWRKRAFSDRLSTLPGSWGVVAAAVRGRACSLTRCDRARRAGYIYPDVIQPIQTHQPSDSTNRQKNTPASPPIHREAISILFYGPKHKPTDLLQFVKVENYMFEVLRPLTDQHTPRATRSRREPAEWSHVEAAGPQTVISPFLRVTRAATPRPAARHRRRGPPRARAAVRAPPR